ncbi:helix-turn-helix transcriptional regulator [Pseudoalteromonas sp. S2755]|uniref:helix-turn-helix domain-containing protein n=1 Tax=Pseudoalteromonas sp. S2755 TaxID=2066523 RepID=UPI00110BF3B1|nr:helix-turn-helix transcriptional regulator [Pseudoalteromonas sp. S2755]TMN34122.1 XRE family transcriptional regulator [Pseudoalteromonas sp. S2755]
MALSGGELLRLGRIARKMSQEDVVSLYGGISISTYRRWEGGKTLIPYDELKAIIEQVFKLSFTHLLAMDLQTNEQLKISA